MGFNGEDCGYAIVLGHRPWGHETLLQDLLAYTAVIAIKHNIMMQILNIIPFERFWLHFSKNGSLPCFNTF